MKTTRHSLMAKGILVLLSLLVLIFAFTFSWFTIVEPEATAYGLNIRAHGASDFEYAIGFKLESTHNNYVHTDFTNAQASTLNLKALTVSGYSDPLDLLYDFEPIDITGDGVTLIRPSMDYGNWKINEGTNNYSIAEPNVQYISFDLIVRSKRQCTLSLDKNSYAKGRCEKTAGNGALNVGESNIGTSARPNSLLNIFKVKNEQGNLVDASPSVAYNKSIYGDFSKDAIVGATRVAFIGYDNSGDASFNGAKMRDEEQTTFNTSPELLWIPRPDIYLNNNDNGNNNKDLDTSGWTLETNVASNTTFNLRSKAQNKDGYSTYEHQYYDVFNISQGQDPEIVEDNASTTKASSINNGTVTFGQSATVMDINVLDDTDNDGVTDPDEYYYGKVRVRIWIEGTDSESRRALAGGQFSINFDLTTN